MLPHLDLILLDALILQNHEPMVPPDHEHLDELAHHADREIAQAYLEDQSRDMAVLFE